MPDNNSNKTYRSISSRIPGEKKLRDHICVISRRFVKQKEILPPVSIEQLRQYCKTMIEDENINPEFSDFLAVCINNEIWKDSVLSVSFDKRLLLLPKCLRNLSSCNAEFDRFGLVCRHCGGCVISSIIDKAETLGYTVLVAEGSPMVMSLISSGKIEAIIGVSCLSVLEQTFPYMEAGAIAGIAIPLLYDGCRDTCFDIDQLDEVLSAYNESGHKRIDLGRIRDYNGDLFSKRNLRKYFHGDDSETARIAMDWMSGHGKRFRPVITSAVYQTLRDDVDIYQSRPADLSQIAVAIECFHKASLIHDDIEDNDDYRYSAATVHNQHGIAIALNTGDYLLGLGYQLIAHSEINSDIKVKMLAAASDAHYQLSIGQGNELTWLKSRTPLSVEQVLEIFRQKTAPAFEVALKLGLYLADSYEDIEQIIEDYSRNLGIAYQILDDINDFDKAVKSGQLRELKSSLFYALAWEGADFKQKNLLESIWSEKDFAGQSMSELMNIFSDLSVKRRAIDMLNCYKCRAVDAISSVKHTSLKCLLRIIISKIFSEIDIMSCCDDYSSRDDK